MQFIKTSAVKVSDERQREDLGDLEGLIRSIKRSGIISPILLDEENNLIAGERRLTAAIEAGLLEIPYVKRDETTEESRHRLELEENLHRLDLTWQEKVRAVSNYHDLCTSQEGEDWTYEKTAEMLGYSASFVFQYCLIQSEIDVENKGKTEPRIVKCQTVNEALNTARRIRERRAASVTDSIISLVTDTDNEPQLPASPPLIGEIVPEFKGETSDLIIIDEATNFSIDDMITDIEKPAPVSLKENETPIINMDFLKFVPPADFRPNFLHVDFPYGLDLNRSNFVKDGKTSAYDDGFELYQELVEHLGNVTYIAENCHMIFWFSMKYYWITQQWLQNQGWKVNEHPLIWVKSDNKGILSDAKRRYRHIYETAFFCTKGDFPIVSPVSDAFSYPMGDNSKRVHRSEKPIEMLAHFFRATVDENTTMLDPTCGSGNSVIQAKKMGAKVLGLEIDPQIYGDAVTNYERNSNE